MEIELYSKINDPIKGIKDIGEFFAKSGMFGCERMEQGMVLAMACLTERVSPFVIKRKYHLQNGELSMRADAMLADFETIAGGKFKVIQRDAEVACIELSRNGNTNTFRFTWEDAKLEPFVWGKDRKTPKKNWATPRARTQMLWARAVSDGVRTMAPHIVAGSYTPEEIDDSPAAQREIFPPKPNQAAGSDAAINQGNCQSSEPAPAPAVEIKAEIVSEPAPAAPAAPKLSPEICAQLVAAIGAKNMGKAIEFLHAKKKIRTAELTAMDELDPAWAQKILNDPAKFIDAIGGECV